MINISGNGASFVLAKKIGEPDAKITFELAVSDTLQISLESRIVWLKEIKDGAVRYGIEFKVREELLNKQLIKLLEHMLMEPDDRKRQHHRLSKRVPIECSSDSELKAMIENISMGGVAFTVSESIEVGKTVEISVPYPDQPGEFFRIDGKVLRCQPVDDLYMIGVQFSEISLLEQDRLQAILQRLL